MKPYPYQIVSAFGAFLATALLTVAASAPAASAAMIAVGATA